MFAVEDSSSDSDEGKVRFGANVCASGPSEVSAASEVSEELSRWQLRKARASRVREAIRGVVETVAFDYLIGLLIVFNGVSIGLETDYMICNDVDRGPPIYGTIEQCLFFVFAGEIILRLCAGDANVFFFGPSWRWNWFDTIMVVMQSVSQIMDLANIGNDEGQGKSFMFIRLLRLLRLIRIMRIARLLRFISELQLLTLSIVGSLRSLFYTVVLLFLMLYVVAVFLTQLVVDKRSELGADAEDSQAIIELKVYYASLARSILSLYQAILSGLDWAELMEPIIQHLGVWAGLVFALFMAFVLLAMMNIVTGVFVESSLKNAKENHENNLLSLAQQLFGTSTHSGAEQQLLISWEDFEAQLDNPIMKDFFKIIDIDISEAKLVFSLLDVEGVDAIDLDHFLNGVLGLRGPCKAIDLSLFVQADKVAKRKALTNMGIIRNELRTVTESLTEMQKSTESLSLQMTLNQLANAAQMTGESSSERGSMSGSMLKNSSTARGWPKTSDLAKLRQTSGESSAEEEGPKGWSKDRGSTMKKPQQSRGVRMDPVLGGCDEDFTA
jgi:voltage-gated sodium channel